MAKNIGYKRITELKPTSWAIFQGTFASIIGLGVAIIHSINATVAFAEATDRVIGGLAFGLATGIVSILVLPLIYFGFGWLVGIVQGWIFNTILGASGGLVVKVSEEE